MIFFPDPFSILESGSRKQDEPHDTAPRRFKAVHVAGASVATDVCHSAFTQYLFAAMAFVRPLCTVLTFTFLYFDLYVSASVHTVLCAYSSGFCTRVSVLKVEVKRYTVPYRNGYRLRAGLAQTTGLSA